MAYFSHGESKHKLMLLYFLREIDYEITRNEFYRVFAEQSWIDYFDFQTALTALEEDAFVAAVPCAFGQGYRITPHGEKTLKLFEEELPYSLREEIKRYSQENRAFLRDQSQFSARQTQMPDGAQLVLLRLMDKNAQLLSISLQMPTAQLANAACEAWRNAAGGIYQGLLRDLLEVKEL